MWLCNFAVITIVKVPALYFMQYGRIYYSQKDSKPHYQPLSHWKLWMNTSKSWIENVSSISCALLSLLQFRSFTAENTLTAISSSRENTGAFISFIFFSLLIVSWVWRLTLVSLTFNFLTKSFLDWREKSQWMYRKKGKKIESQEWKEFENQAFFRKMLSSSPSLWLVPVVLH